MNIPTLKILISIACLIAAMGLLTMSIAVDANSVLRELQPQIIRVAHGSATSDSANAAKLILNDFIECLKNADGEKLYGMLPHSARNSFDQFFNRNKSLLQKQGNSAKKLIVTLLREAKNAIPEEGYGYGLVGFLQDVYDEDFNQIFSTGKIEGNHATFTTSEGEELNFEFQSDGWQLEESFARNIVAYLIVCADI